MSTVNAVQINYADQDVDSTFLGKIPGIYSSINSRNLQTEKTGKYWLIKAITKRIFRMNTWNCPNPSRRVI